MRRQRSNSTSGAPNGKSRFNAANFRSKIEALLVAKGLKPANVSLKSFRPFLRSAAEDSSP